jgi:hypothetical protein
VETSALPAGRPRAGHLWRPVGRSRWGLAGWLALGLGASLAVTALRGNPEFGSAMALGIVLTAVPSLPTAVRPALVTIAVRGATVLAGAVTVVLCAGHLLAVAVATVVAAIAGAMFQRIGPTAGLAVILIAVHTDDGPVSVVTTYPYLLGVAVVLIAWLAWFGCTGAIRMVRRRPEESTVTGDGGACGGVDYAHAARVGVAVGAAVTLAALLPRDMVGGHWLVTSVLLTIQPGQYDTGVRLLQRISGNAVGALIAAAVLGAHPAAPVLVTVTVVLFLLAMALRPVNYTWWAVTGPPVLLMISEYPQLFPWYEGGVRLAMNIGGAAIVLAVVFVLPVLSRRRRPRLTIAIDFE